MRIIFAGSSAVEQVVEVGGDDVAGTGKMPIGVPGNEGITVSKVGLPGRGLVRSRSISRSSREAGGLPASMGPVVVVTRHARSTAGSAATTVFGVCRPVVSAKT